MPENLIISEQLGCQTLPHHSSQGGVVGGVNHAGMRAWRMRFSFVSHNRDNIRIRAFRMEEIRQTRPDRCGQQMAE